MKAPTAIQFSEDQRIFFRNTLISMVLLLFLMVGLVEGQSDYADHYGRNLEINNVGMAVLGSWALVNMSIGAYGWSQNTGQRAYFHQMNVFWNAVNLSIAGFALYSNLTADYTLLSGEELLEKQYKIQRLYLINAAVDVGYVSVGFLLKHLATKYPKNELRLRGYGNSIILQGSFLFVFDLLMYGVLQSHRAEFLQQVSFSPMHDSWGLALSYNF